MDFAMNNTFDKQKACNEIRAFDELRDMLKKPEQNLALLGPEGCGLEELLENTYNEATRKAMFAQGYIVTKVDSFLQPEAPRDLYNRLTKAAHAACKAVQDEDKTGRIRSLCADYTPAEKDSYEDAKEEFRKFLKKLPQKKNGSPVYRIVFSYKSWEYFIFSGLDRGDSRLIDIHEELRTLSYSEKRICFVVTTPYGLVGTADRSSFVDTFSRVNLPQLSPEQIEEVLRPVWPCGKWEAELKKAAWALQVWSGGNLRLIELFLEELGKANGNLKEAIIQADKNTNVNDMLARWCDYLEDIPNASPYITLDKFASNEPVTGNDSGISHLESVGLVLPGQKGYRLCCLAFACFLQREKAKKGAKPVC